MSIVTQIHYTLITNRNDNKPDPETMAISYDDGIKLLEEYGDLSHHGKIKNMIMNSDRDEIKKHLNSCKVFGVKLVVADLLKI